MPPGDAPGPWRTRRPSGPTISTASSMPKSPSTATMPAGRSDRPRSTRARRAPASTSDAARGADGEGDPELAGRQHDLPWPEACAHARRGGGDGGQHARTGGVGDDGLDPRPHGDLGRRQLGSHAPAAHRRPGPTGDGLEFVVDLDHLLDERGVGVTPRVAGQQPGGVGQQDQEPGPDQMGDQGGQAVVVPEADLLVGHRVVLVDHRDDTQLEQASERLAGVQVLAAVDEVEGGQQHLAGRQSVGAERVAPHPHQQVLADGGHGLERGQIVGTGPALGQARPPGGDGARRHDHHAGARPRGPGPPRRPACRWRRCPPARRPW